jgi:hypothetical protein
MCLDVREVGGPDVADSLVAEACHAPFRLAAGESPGRLVLFQGGSGDAVLALVVHHIATDATSQWMLLADLLDEYQKADADDPAEASPVAGSYDAYVEQERRFLASPERARLAGFWRAECAGAVAAELLTDRPRPDRQTFAGATFKLALAGDTASRVRAAASSVGVTPFGFLLGVFTALLNRHSGQDDLTVGCVATNRRGHAMRDIVGYLVNPIIVRVRLGTGLTFADAARLAQGCVATGVRHARYPFPVLVRDLGVPRHADRAPLLPTGWQAGSRMASSILTCRAPPREWSRCRRPAHRTGCSGSLTRGRRFRPIPGKRRRCFARVWPTCGCSWSSITPTTRTRCHRSCPRAAAARS